MADIPVLQPQGFNKIWKDLGGNNYAEGVAVVSGVAGGGPATVADGADVAEGATTDAIVAAGATGSVSAKLRRLTQGVEDLKTLITIAGVPADPFGANADAAVAAGAAGSIQAKLRRATQGLEDLKTLIVLAAGENHVGQVGGTTTTVSDEFARPNDSSPYTAGDAVSATTSDTGTTVLRPLTNVARVAAGSGYLTKFRLWTDQKTCVARIRIHLYTVAAPTTAVPGDNVPMTIKWTNRAQRVGTVDMPALATETDSTNSTAAHALDATTRLAFTCAAADRNLYYRIVSLDTFTPAALQNFFLECVSEGN